MAASSIRAMAREVGTMPVRVLAAMSLMAATFERDRPAPRRRSSGVASKSSGVGNRWPG